jgi:hypothetical protein
MQAVKIILSSAERKRCVCGATLQMSCDPDDSRRTQLWRCNHHCGARGRSYEGALRRKVRLDPLSWGDLRRKAQPLIAAATDDSTNRLHKPTTSQRPAIAYPNISLESRNAALQKQFSPNPAHEYRS